MVFFVRQCSNGKSGSDSISFTFCQVMVPRKPSGTTPTFSTCRFIVTTVLSTLVVLTEEPIWSEKELVQDCKLPSIVDSCSSVCGVADGLSIFLLALSMYHSRMRVWGMQIIFTLFNKSSCLSLMNSLLISSLVSSLLFSSFCYYL